MAVLCGADGLDLLDGLYERVAASLAVRSTLLCSCHAVEGVRSARRVAKPSKDFESASMESDGLVQVAVSGCAATEPVQGVSPIRARRVLTICQRDLEVGDGTAQVPLAEAHLSEGVGGVDDTELRPGLSCCVQCELEVVLGLADVARPSVEVAKVLAGVDDAARRSD